MTDKVRIDAELIKSICNTIDYINSLDLEDVVFYQKGKALDILKQDIADFKYTGLSNIDFILTEFWKRKINTKQI